MVRSRCAGSRGLAVLIRAPAGDVNGLYGDQPIDKRLVETGQRQHR